MSGEQNVRVSERRSLVIPLLAVLVISAVAWVFWPYPESNPVLRSFLGHLESQPGVVLRSIDSSGYATYADGRENPLEGVPHIAYSETTPFGYVWHVSLPVLSSVSVEDGASIAALTAGVVSERAGLWERSRESAKRRVSMLGALAQDPSAAALRRVFVEDGMAMACLFSPDFELRAADRPENRLLLCMECLKVKCWVDGDLDSAYFGTDVREQFFAFAEAAGMDVSAKWSEFEE